MSNGGVCCSEFGFDCSSVDGFDCLCDCDYWGGFPVEDATCQCEALADIPQYATPEDPMPYTQADYILVA